MILMKESNDTLVPTRPKKGRNLIFSLFLSPGVSRLLLLLWDCEHLSISLVYEASCSLTVLYYYAFQKIILSWMKLWHPAPLRFPLGLLLSPMGFSAILKCIVNITVDFTFHCSKAFLCPRECKLESLGLSVQVDIPSAALHHNFVSLFHHPPPPPYLLNFHSNEMWREHL